MATICACKGIRTCLICENKCVPLVGNEHQQSQRTLFNDAAKKEFVYCNICKNGFLLTPSCVNKHPDHSDVSIEFPGIELVEDFIDDIEESKICAEIDQVQWIDSQSGRRKQDYGPKVNFKKKKLQMKVFSGFPPFSEALVERFKRVPLLKENFIPIELCNLEYTPERGSAIDPHFDDFWLWGEKLVTLNILSDTYLSMTRDNSDIEVLVPLPRRSLLVVYGPARYEWKHGIHRHHIEARRLAVTFRELTPEFLPGGLRESDGNVLIQTAMNYNGISVGCIPNK
ncbi:alpha-ketoglutarate-dependent dioxygenase alkB homolog 4-like [Tubulanus polymorphus]|uniref:alpha-ketoglutarate-dependent dioxygenase alkB homolog 4-like n=1 Tax=Tubulanus polymorphus TaxID=672921 RepID=UPI003DA2B51C